MTGKNHTDKCLNDVEVQMLADDRPPPQAAAHVAGCDSCAARLAARRRIMQEVIDGARRIDASPARLAALRRNLHQPSPGSTTLRQGYGASRSPWLALGGAVAATLLIVAVLPRLNRTETVSAAEILSRSRAALSSPSSGVETLIYDLALDGVLAQIFPEEQVGRFTVEEVNDHDHAGRFRILKLAPDGTPVAGAAEDPLTGQRIRYIRAHGRGYLLRFSGAQPAPLPLTAIKRAALQSFVAIMQGQRDVTVTESSRAGEPVFIVEVPHDRPFAAGVPFGLTRGRAVIAAEDARLWEVEAAGTIADQPFSLSFVLRERQLRAGPAASSQFDIAPRPEDILLAGSGTANPMWDVVSRALRATEATEAAR